MPPAEVLRKRGISRATPFRWRAKYENVTGSELSRLRELEQENARLKPMYAELALENVAISAGCGWSGTRGTRSGSTACTARCA